MSKLLVINSYGPMASTLLAGLAEKLGYSNYPVRKMRLHRYLTGEYALSSGEMQRAMLELIKRRSMPGHYGGVSVKDRDSQAARALVDYALIEGQADEFLRYQPASIEDLYDACRRMFRKALTYKDDSSRDGWHIELTTDILRYDPAVLAEAYGRHFKDVKMIHLHRPFRGWINSLASQAFHNPSLSQSLSFFPHFRYRDYMLYEDTVRKLPGLHLEFDALFDTPIEDLARKIADFAGCDMPDIDWRAQNYDMYGKLVPYERAFKRFDDGQVYLSPRTLDIYCAEISRDRPFRGGRKFLFWFYFLRDMLAYRLRNRKV